MDKKEAMIDRIDSDIEDANDELELITKDGFPFTFEEVEMHSYDDEAGVYVYCGETPVFVASIKDDFRKVAKAAARKIRDTVESVRLAIESRGSLKGDAERLIEEDAKKRAAVDALRAAGLDPADTIACFDEASASSIVDAARKAARKVNRGMYVRFEEISDLVGGLRGIRLSVRGFIGGLVVSAGGKPCLVSRFPKVWNARSIDKMISFLSAEIAAIGESRRRYFNSVLEEYREEERLQDAAVNAA